MSSLRHYERVKKKFQCEFQCLTDCGCDLFASAAAEFMSLEEADRNLLIEELCTTGCPVDLVIPPPQGGGSGAQGGAECLTKLVEFVCTADRKAKLALLRTYINMIKGIMGDDETGLLAGYVALIDVILSFCSSPTGGRVEQAMNTICSTWPKLKAGLDQMNTWAGMLGPLSGAAKQLLGYFALTGPLSKVLDECCGAGAVASGTEIVSTIPVTPSTSRLPSSGTAISKSGPVYADSPSNRPWRPTNRSTRVLFR